MKNHFNFLIPIFAVIIMGCDRSPSITKYYPSELNVTDSTCVLFSLDSLSINFNEFFDKCYEIEDENKQTVVSFFDGDTLKKVKIHIIGNGTFYKKNILNIINDSISKEINYPLDDLEKIMTKHYFNNGKIDEYADSPEKAIILITLTKEEKLSNLKKYLIAITRVQNSINQKNKTTMNLPVYINISVPPPPQLNPNTID